MSGRAMHKEQLIAARARIDQLEIELAKSEQRARALSEAAAPSEVESAPAECGSCPQPRSYTAGGVVGFATTSLLITAIALALAYF